MDILIINLVRMRKFLTKALIPFALMMLLVVNSALATETATEDPYTDDQSITLTLEGSENNEGNVDLSWSEYDGGDLKWYKIVHSQTVEAPKYPTDGYVEYYTDATDTTYTHTGAKGGTNYYAVCIITEDNKRGCSNTVTIEKDATQEEETTTEEKTTDDPYTDDPAISFALVGELNDQGQAELSWEQYEGEDFKWYKVVHSQTNETPKYPTDGYIEVHSEATGITQTHKDVPVGTNYYAVCVITTDDKRGCSNTVQLDKTDDSEIASFNDISDHWAKDYIDDLYQEGVVEGNDGDYRPNDSVVRAEAVKVILIGLGFEQVSCDSTLFPDVAASNWFCGIVTKAYVAGFVQGDQGFFYPGRTLNRAEAVIILLKSKGITPPEISEDPFPDVAFDSWYGPYAYKAKKLGYIEGINGNFEPFQEITRAELAKIVSLASK